MSHLIQTFQERFSEWSISLGQHLYISLISLLLAIILAVPLAILLSHRLKLATIAVQVTGIFQTVPSMALLGLFIPFLGIGTLPAVSALVIYGFFPIFQNTLTALQGIDPNLQEAATAFGMTKMEKLRKFELSLSMPVIIAGVRTSAVMIIGTATLAALVGAGGMGSFILLGIDRNNTSLILIGALSSAFLAVCFNVVLKWMERAKLKTIMISFCALLLGVSSLTIGQWLNTTQQKTIIIGGKLGPEPEILMNMYKILLEEQTNLVIEVKPNFGTTTFVYEALKNGAIDIYPEFTGTITTSLLQDKPLLSQDEQVVYLQAKEGILKQDNLIYLDPMKFHNTFGLAVKKSFAQQYDLRKVSDLNKVERIIKAGFTLEFNDREDGNLGLKSLYGLNLSVVTMEPNLRYQAMENDDVNLIEVFSTDSEIAQYDLVVLEDDLHMFPPYQAAPLMRKELLNQHPEIEKILNQLSGKITQEEMSQMNYMVKVEQKDAYKVAKDYLVTIGLSK